MIHCTLCMRYLVVVGVVSLKPCLAYSWHHHWPQSSSYLVHSSTSTSNSLLQRRWGLLFVHPPLSHTGYLVQFLPIIDFGCFLLCFRIWFPVNRLYSAVLLSPPFFAKILEVCRMRSHHFWSFQAKGFRSLTVAPTFIVMPTQRARRIEQSAPVL